MKNEVSKAWKVGSLSQLGYSHLVDGNVKNYVERNYETVEHLIWDCRYLYYMEQYHPGVIRSIPHSLKVCMEIFEYNHLICRNIDSRIIGMYYLYRTVYGDDYEPLILEYRDPKITKKAHNYQLTDRAKILTVHDWNQLYEEDICIDLERSQKELKHLENIQRVLQRELTKREYRVVNFSFGLQGDNIHNLRETAVNEGLLLTQTDRHLKSALKKIQPYLTKI